MAIYVYVCVYVHSCMCVYVCVCVYIYIYSDQKKVQPLLILQYNKNGLHDINITWQPRRVDWNVHV